MHKRHRLVTNSHSCSQKGENNQIKTELFLCYLFGFRELLSKSGWKREKRGRRAPKQPKKQPKVFLIMSQSVRITPCINNSESKLCLVDLKGIVKGTEVPSDRQKTRKKPAPKREHEAVGWRLNVRRRKKSCSLLSTFKLFLFCGIKIFMH